ncbi:MAG: TldD/PmbA family protein [Pseudomonadota bacterium]
MTEFSTDILVDRASALVEAATKAGATAADAIAVQSVSKSIEIRNAAVDETEQAERADLGLRVFVDDKSAIVSSNDMATSGYAALAERAVAMAKLAPGNPHLGLAASNEYATEIPELDLLDDDLYATDDLIRMAKEAEAAALSVEGVTKSGSANAGSRLAGYVLVTSNGFSGVSQRTGHSVSATAIAGDGTAMERDYGFHMSVFRSDLETPEEIGIRAGERAIARQNPRKIETQKAPVVFDKRVAASLVSNLAGAINGSAIARGSSFLKTRLGDAIFPNTVTITDDPLVRRGLASRAFDGEGLPSHALSVIDKGKLTTWILDTQTARQLGLTSNGRASRGIGGNPSPSTTNLNMANGTRSQADILGECGTGLLVTSMFGRGVDLVTGDYSRGVSGFWFENGEIAYPVSEITIAGNLTEMFATIEPADDLEIRGATNAPSLFVGEMTIAGS